MTALWLTQYQLKAKSPERRVRAVRKLRALGNAPALVLLIQSLDDSDREVRREAAVALGEIKDQQSVEALIRAVRDPVESVQEAAIQSLKRLGDPSAEDALLGALMRGSPPVQSRAASALQVLGWRAKSSAEEIQLLVATGRLQHAAKYGLAAVNALSALLHSDAYAKRVAAANALGEINDPAVVKLLTSALKDADPLVRTASANALGRLANPQAVTSLISVLKDRDRNVRVAAAVALGKLEDEKAVEPLIALISDKDWDVRAAALESLGRLGDRRAFEPVANSLADDDQAVRQNAAEALGRVGDGSVLEKLVLTMVDEHSNVRQAAARALTKLDPEWERSERVQQLVPKIEVALKHKELGVQFAAASLIRQLTGRNPAESFEGSAPTVAERKKRATVRIVQDMLRDSDVEVRLAAAELVGQARLSSCVEALTIALEDASTWVRQAASQSLQSLPRA